MTRASVQPTLTGVLALVLLACVTLASATKGPYDERADPKADIAAALGSSRADDKPVLVVFGANWCGDCRTLEEAFTTGRAAPLIARNFHVVKVDVGRFDRNVEVAGMYGVPLRKGIPAIAVLAPEGNVVYATAGGELADARGMGDSGIEAFFRGMLANRR